MSVHDDDAYSSFAKRSCGTKNPPDPTYLNITPDDYSTRRVYLAAQCSVASYKLRPLGLTFVLSGMTMARSQTRKPVTSANGARQHIGALVLEQSNARVARTETNGRTDGPTDRQIDLCGMQSHPRSGVAARKVSQTSPGHGRGEHGRLRKTGQQVYTRETRSRARARARDRFRTEEVESFWTKRRTREGRS